MSKQGFPSTQRPVRDKGPLGPGYETGGRFDGLWSHREDTGGSRDQQNPYFTLTHDVTGQNLQTSPGNDTQDQVESRTPKT